MLLSLNREVVECMDNIRFLPDLVSEHLQPGEEDPTEVFLPKEAKTGRTLLSAAHKLLQSHNREHPLS